MTQFRHAFVPGAAPRKSNTAVRRNRIAWGRCPLPFCLVLVFVGPAAVHAECPAAPSSHRVIAPGDVCLVTEPVVDLRREPQTASPPAGRDGRFAVDPLQETQLLFCEQVQVEEVRDGWARVEATEQQEYTRNGRWQGYPGWCPAETLALRPDEFTPDAVVCSPHARLHAGTERSDEGRLIGMGARVDALDVDERWVRVRCPGGGSAWLLREHVRLLDELPGEIADLRSAVVHSAAQFIGQPYLWGGRSFHDPELRDGLPTGVDCSGLVHTAYRLNGISIPRDAHEQFLRARAIPLSETLPGDLVFLARRESPEKIFHVLLSLGGEQAIESSLDGSGVRFITMKDKTGIALKDTAVAGLTGRFVVHAGRFLLRER